MTGIELALKAVDGNQSELARRCDVTPQAVQAWVKDGVVPWRKCQMVEAITGVPRAKLNPLVYADRPAPRKSRDALSA